MKKQLVFATNNTHKLEEIVAILGKEYQIISLKELGCTEDIPETANTLEGNALLKAQYVSERYDVDCFADDTGLEITALNGAPGVYSARYAGESKNPQANMLKVLEELKEKTDYSAHFRTVIALIKDGQVHLFEGIVEGEIIREKRGTAGFGYDPVFVPKGFTQTFAELGTEVKNTISHRAEAIKKLKQFLDHEK